MKILFWGKSPCIRTYKEAKALRTHGLETMLAYTGKTIESRYVGLKAEDAFSEVFKADQVYMPHFVEDNDIDIIHTAHPPDVSVRNLLGCGVPIVHDLHDLYSLEGTDPTLFRYEQDAVGFASGLVYVSDLMEKYVKTTHSSVAIERCLISNAADDIPFVKQSRPWPNNEIHVVYAAAMPHLGDGHFRDLQASVQDMCEQGIHLHVHALIVQKALKDLEAVNRCFHIEPHAVGAEMLSMLSKYDAGIIPHRSSNGSVRKHIGMSSPNKLYEYWQVGIPTICYDAKETRRVIDSYKLGWIADNFMNVKSLLKQTYKPNRTVITMKEEVSKLIALYENIVWK